MQFVFTCNINFITSHFCYGNGIDSIWSCKGIINLSTGNVYINGSNADKCGNEENTLGICVYNKNGRGVLNENNAKGNIYINGGSIVSVTNAAVSNYTGKTYICNGYIDGNKKGDITNRKNDGYLYYKSNVQLKYGFSSSDANIVLDDSITCNG